MMPLIARKRAFGPKRLAAGQVCRLSDLQRHPQPATLVDFRGSSLSDAGSIPAISTIKIRAELARIFVVFLCSCAILVLTQSVTLSFHSLLRRKL